MYGYAFYEGVAMDFSSFFIKRPETAEPALAFSPLPGGLPTGKLVEMRGVSGKTDALLQVFRENPELQIAWIEVRANIYPCAFSERGVDLDRVLFIEAADAHEALTCAHQVLKSQIFGAVVLSQLDAAPAVPFIPHTTQPSRPRDSRSFELRGPRSRSGVGEIELRRLQLAAGKSGGTVFLINECAVSEENWPIEVQLEVSRAQGELKVQIIKSRTRRDLWDQSPVDRSTG